MVERGHRRAGRPGRAVRSVVRGVARVPVALDRVEVVVAERDRLVVVDEGPAGVRRDVQLAREAADEHAGARRVAPAGRVEGDDRQDRARLPAARVEDDRGDRRAARAIPAPAVRDGEGRDVRVVGPAPASERVVAAEAVVCPHPGVRRRVLRHAAAQAQLDRVGGYRASVRSDAPRAVRQVLVRSAHREAGRLAVAPEDGIPLLAVRVATAPVGELGGRDDVSLRHGGRASGDGALHPVVAPVRVREPVVERVHEVVERGLRVGRDLQDHQHVDLEAAHDVGDELHLQRRVRALAVSGRPASGAEVLQVPHHHADARHQRASRFGAGRPGGRGGGAGGALCSGSLR